MSYSTEQFVEKARKVHDDKYNYSKVKYKNCKTKIPIICSTHGEFIQTPNDHLKGSGCPKCARANVSCSTEQFIEKARKIHGNKYNYYKVNYINSYTKVTIVCPEHGEFKQIPNDHLQGSGCLKCVRANMSYSTEQFIEKARKVHGNRYDYSKVKYRSIRIGIIIICPRHGEFAQTPESHLVGSGCIECARDSILDTTEQFIEKARKVHGNRYDYSKVNYINSYTKVIIVCPEHGEFKQSTKHHLKGSGCLKCARANVSCSTEQFIEKARKIYGNKYDYSKVNYINSYTKVTIVCPEHGEFKQIPKIHLQGKRCLECAISSMLDTTEQFIEKARKIHGDKYDYSKVKYKNSKAKVTIICPAHGEFKQIPNDHLQGKGCSVCPAVVSSGHQGIIDYIKSVYSDDIAINDRQAVSPLELDIYVPEHKFAIEYNGSYWHSYGYVESTEERRRHQHKTDQCLGKGIELYQIFEYEWVNNIKQNIWKSMISHKLGQSNRIYARKCEIKEVSNKDVSKFFNESHLQGHRDAKKCYGLYYQDDLVASMTFSPSHNKSWEIIRYACKPFNTVVGGAQRLFKRFLKDINPQNIITYADRRHSVGNLYRKMGFKEVKATSPNYVYLNKNNIYSRQKFQKHKLKKKLEVFNPELTEAENMFTNGYRRIWDAGHYKYQI